MGGYTNNQLHVREAHTTFSYLIFDGAERVATVDETREKLAHLFAAAPELLGECRGLCAVFLHHQCPRCGIAWSEDECQEMAGARLARCLCGYEQELKGAAISRATGEGQP